MKRANAFCCAVALSLTACTREGSGSCLPNQEAPSACRYKQGDAWCAKSEHGKPYAYWDACVKEIESKNSVIGSLRTDNERLRQEIERLHRSLRTQIASAPQPSASPARAQVPAGSQPQLLDLTGRFIKLTQDGDDQFIEFLDNHLCVYDDCIEYSQTGDSIWVTFPHSASKRRIEIKGESLVISNSPGGIGSLVSKPFVDVSLDGVYFKEGSENVDYIHKAFVFEDQSPTVVSRGTGLEWMRCAVGQEWTGTTCIGQASTMKWQDAMRRYEQGFSALGHNDWRLPTAMEFERFVVNDHPLITSPLAFPNNPDGVYWSSSKSTWYIYGMEFHKFMVLGEAYLYPGWKILDNVPASGDCYVRLVRERSR